MSGGSAHLLDLIDGGPPGVCAALLGGGGKTTLLERLGDELAKKHDTVLVSSLTKTWGHLADRAIKPETALRDGLTNHASRHNPVWVLGEREGPHKTAGISEAELDSLRQQSNASVFECDGARNLPLKVHLPHDPAVPAFATHVIILVGAEVVGTSLNDGLIHRPAEFARYWSIDPAWPVDAEFVTEVISTRRGYLDKVPEGIEITCFVNKADLAPGQAKELARVLTDRAVGSVFYGSLQENWLERVRQ